MVVKEGEVAHNIVVMKAPRVGLNALYLRPGKVGGSEVYVRSLARALVDETNVKLVVFVPRDAAESFSGLARKGAHVVPVGNGSFSQAGRIVAENVGLLRHVHKHALDVLFSPANFGAPLLASRIPQVVTVHDLQHRWLKSNFSRAKRLQRDAMFHASFRRAVHVIAISDFTRGDVLNAFRIHPDRITTVLEGFDPGASPTEEAIASCHARHGLSGPTLYYPATDNAHKNHELLFETLGLLAKRGERPTLVLTGSTSGRYERLQLQAQGTGIDDQVRHLGFVSREDVYALMAGADALVFPSRFEGFGLPILEAMECETPVIAARCASIPEVAGNAAVLLDPDAPDAWADAISAALSNGPESERLIALGKVNLQRFSWVECAKQSATIFQNAARHSR
ncbi:MAG: glycosyltransferase involved in cell wall biosynthesis [Myxococcota bacterium]